VGFWRYTFNRKEGYLYDKESVLEYIITKKNENSRKMKEYERQKKKEESELVELAEAEKASQVSKFVKQESGITVKSTFDPRSE
jgi:nitric oxide synthase-interacting protein